MVAWGDETTATKKALLTVDERKAASMTDMKICLRAAQSESLKAVRLTISKDDLWVACLADP